MRSSLSIFVLLHSALSAWSFSPKLPLTSFDRLHRHGRNLAVHPSSPRSRTRFDQSDDIQSSRVSNRLLSTNDDAVDSTLEVIDNLILKRLVRFANHVPALASLYYFGLISTSSMMGPSVAPIGEATLAGVLTKYVGMTSNAEFSAMFPTLVTPANPIFLVWPIISVLQLLTVSVSALKPGAPVLSQNDLSSLSLANLAATGWLILSSGAEAGLPPPLGCALVLPLVPLLSGYALRNPRYFSSTSPTFGKFVFQVFSSFTTIASFLALAVELQHGGRIPFFLGRPEFSAAAFLSLAAATVMRQRQGIARKFVTFGALGGILWRRVSLALADGFGRTALLGLAKSASFWGTSLITLWAFGRLLDSDDKYGDNL
mmetsp:Transcript_57536/g.171605  ORF Transcript_57536/g.171605 Transcript_57536/m.171605 type:complete len:372 (-) Transcript_57536:152-1267(-)|eukprot:CAMPEP_0113549976 /NCGR_PEP_ID=MMETSP0015_2-20120614/13732_1 /TAXON_ID=2838 /ORGANISM="Odontella" /LENGTH=371 /DNA_ID=CAMNT_0000450745 /DNA_START=76 /DNA_END=1191 /DNA_ORIENTATION=+ /assembly_acc=CAM_ASM_000160